MEKSVVIRVRLEAAETEGGVKQAPCPAQLGTLAGGLALLCGWL